MRSYGVLSKLGFVYFGFLTHGFRLFRIFFIWVCHFLFFFELIFWHKFSLSLSRVSLLLSVLCGGRILRGLLEVLAPLWLPRTKLLFGLMAVIFFRYFPCNSARTLQYLSIIFDRKPDYNIYTSCNSHVFYNI